MPYALPFNELFSATSSLCSRSIVSASQSIESIVSSAAFSAPHSTTPKPTPVQLPKKQHNCHSLDDLPRNIQDIILEFYPADATSPLPDPTTLEQIRYVLGSSNVYSEKISLLQLLASKLFKTPVNSPLFHIKQGLNSNINL
jgi:histone deacetylase complex regulatory component SIN3